VSVRTAVVSVEVETRTETSLSVRWVLEGEPAAVDVAIGATPDHVDHRHETTVQAGRTTLELDGLDPGRHYVSVSPHDGVPAVVAADRRVRFDGISNFRDLGGYRNRAGDTVRWGLVFRSDALHGLSGRDLERYEGLGLRVVYDLRRDDERDERPNPVPSRPLTIIGRSADEPFVSPASPRMTAADGERVLQEMYVGLLEHSALQIGELFTGLVEDDGLPAVFHCHAGKDRTGIVAALLLEALGVEREHVLDDYELTGRYRLRSEQESSFGRLIEAGLSPEAAAGVLTTPRWAMQHALDELDARHGGVDAFLIGPAQVRAVDLERLRARLLA
jgi:protein-tyrosine phosphatase